MSSTHRRGDQRRECRWNPRWRVGLVSGAAPQRRNPSAPPAVRGTAGRGAPTNSGERSRQGRSHIGAPFAIPTRRASEGSAAGPSLARRVSIGRRPSGAGIPSPPPLSREQRADVRRQILANAHDRAEVTSGPRSPYQPDAPAREVPMEPSLARRVGIGRRPSTPESLRAPGEGWHRSVALAVLGPHRL